MRIQMQPGDYVVSHTPKGNIYRLGQVLKIDERSVMLSVAYIDDRPGEISVATIVEHYRKEDMLTACICTESDYLAHIETMQAREIARRIEALLERAAKGNPQKKSRLACAIVADLTIQSAYTE